MKHTKLIAALACTAAALVVAPAAQANLEADYRFEGGFGSSVGSVSKLKPEGPVRLCPPCAKFTNAQVGGSRQGVWKWPKGDGLRLKDANEAMGGGGTKYTFVMLVKLNDVEGYNKLIDFDNQQVENGLYVDDKLLHPYDLDYSDDNVVKEDRWHQIALTRSQSGKVVGYVDGKKVVSAPDPDPDLVLGADDVLHFLIDDEVTGSEEAGGQIARLRIYDEALQEQAIKNLGR